MAKIIQGKAVNDSALSYFVNQLTQLDKTLHMPLMATTYLRDIKLREDISLANQSTSYTLSTFAAAGGLNTGSSAGGGGIPFISNGTTNLQGVDINGQIVTTPLRPAGMSLSYTQMELQASQLLGQPLDTSKFNAINMKYQMGNDQMAYIGDASIGAKGLLNKSTVTTGAASATNWMGGSTTPAQILASVNDLLNSTYKNTGYSRCPTKLLLPPAQFAYIAATPVTTAGSVSILKFLEDNSISMRVNGVPLQVLPVKWLTGTTNGGVGGGVGGTDRMVAYTNDYDLCRFPLVPITGFTPSFHGIIYERPYVWAIGETEIVYPETMQYADGI
jgi:hypothetical protein